MTNSKQPVPLARSIAFWFIMTVFVWTGYIGLANNNNLCLFISGIFFSAIIELAIKGTRLDHEKKQNKLPASIGVDLSSQYDMSTALILGLPHYQCRKCHRWWCTYKHRKSMEDKGMCKFCANELAKETVE